MAELHSVDVDVVEPLDRGTTNHVRVREIAVHKNLRSWLPVARDVLSLPAVSESVRHAFNLDAFSNEWDAYTRWISTQERARGPSERVFAHNDTQYGNLLRMNNPPSGIFPHRQVSISLWFRMPSYSFTFPDNRSRF
jgi:choline kinase